MQFLLQISDDIFQTYLDKEMEILEYLKLRKKSDTFM